MTTFTNNPELEKLQRRAAMTAFALAARKLLVAQRACFLVEEGIITGIMRLRTTDGRFHEQRVDDPQNLYAQAWSFAERLTPP